MLDPLGLLHQRRAEIAAVLGDDPDNTFETEDLLDLLWQYDRAIMTVHFNNQQPMSEQVQTTTKKADEYLPVKDHFVRTLGEEAFHREVSFAVQIINNSKQLQRTTLASRLVAVGNVANIGLSLNPVLKLAYLVPRNVKVTRPDGSDGYEARCFLEPSYIGLVKLATDSGSVRSMHSELVWEGDDIELTLGTDQKVVHVPFIKTGRPKGALKGAYSVAKLTDGSFNVLVMDIDELRKVKAASEAVKKNLASPYDNWEDEMFRKAPIRRHFKTLPKSDRYEILANAIALDEEQYTDVDAELVNANEQERKLTVLRRRIIDALDLYQGDDKDAIASQCAAKVASGEFTEEFATNILASIGDKSL